MPKKTKDEKKIELKKIISLIFIQCIEHKGICNND